MRKLLLILSTALIFLWVACLSKKGLKSDASAAQNPNIILIVADDLGYADVGFNGCTDIPTPNIDRIAKAGVVFSSGHVSFGVCSPSRAGLLTGRYQYRFGYERNPLYVTSDSTMGLPLSEETMADVLGRSGYNNMIIGKWHLGAHPSLHPLKRGFNEFFGFLGGGHQYFPEKWTLQNPEDANGETESYRTKLNRNYTPVEETEYITDAFSREAVSFVERNKTKPFFLYLAYNAPHGPLQATEKYLNRFKNIKNPKRQTYAAMVSAVDDGVGNLLDKLKETGVIDNTIIVFLSDNGGPISDNASDNTPLRGQKGSVFEGGIRVPALLEWPARYNAPIVIRAAASTSDYLPTILSALNQPLPKELDGINLLPILDGKRLRRQSPLAFETINDSRGSPKLGWIEDRWKLLTNLDGKEEMLFDLDADPEESNNLAASQPRLASALRAKLERWRASCARSRQGL